MYPTLYRNPEMWETVRAALEAENQALIQQTALRQQQATAGYVELSSSDPTHHYKIPEEFDSVPEPEEEAKLQEETKHAEEFDISTKPCIEMFPMQEFTPSPSTSGYATPSGLSDKAKHSFVSQTELEQKWRAQAEKGLKKGVRNPL